MSEINTFGPPNMKTPGEYLLEGKNLVLNNTIPEIKDVDIISTDDCFYIEDEIIINKKEILSKKTYFIALQIGSFYNNLDNTTKHLYKKAWEIRRLMNENKKNLLSDLYKNLNYDIIIKYYASEGYKKFINDTDDTIDYYKFLYYHLYQLFGTEVKLSDTNWFPIFVNDSGCRLLWLMHIASTKLENLFYENICSLNSTIPIYLKNYNDFCWMIINCWIINGKIFKQFVKVNKIALYEIFINSKMQEISKTMGIPQGKLEMCKIIYQNDAKFAMFLAQ